MGFSFEEFPNSDYYDSDLREILKYVRDVLAYVKTWDETVEELKADIAELDQMGEDITALKSAVKRISDDISDIETTLLKVKSDIQFIMQNLNEINDWRDVTDVKLRILGTRITNLKIYVDDMDNVLMADYNQKFTIYNLKMKQMQQELMGYITGIIERMEYMIEHLSSDVYDPIRAERLLFDVNNKNIYADLRVGGITECDFAELGLTEEDIQEYNITQYDWAFHSNYFFKQYFIYSPVRGIKMSPYQALSDVLTFICSTMTEAQFEALNLTEEEFEALNLTHKEYLTYNSTDRNVVIVDDNASGLTENQLQHLGIL